MPPPEILACFSIDRIREFETGRYQAIFPVEREAAHKNRIPHLIVRVFAIHRKSRQYLLQKRGIQKSIFPNMFTDSASGHVRFREQFQFECIAEDARRELQEEMNVTALTIGFWRTQFCEAEQELEYCFFAIINQHPQPDKEEVDISESRLYSEQELKLVLNKDEFIPHVKEMWAQILREQLLFKFLNQWEACKYAVGKEKIVPGVIIGRFQPFHRGHIALIKEILQRHNKIIIIIGSKQYSRLPENPFTCEERVRMIRRTIQGHKIQLRKVKILAIDDKHDASKWMDELCALLPPNAVIYSNSEWIRELFRSRGFCLGDILKFNFETYNGTAIRHKLYNGLDWQKDVPAGTKQIIEDVIRHGFLNNLFSTIQRKRENV